MLKDRVARLRPLYLPPDPASRTAYVVGKIAQCDLWFPPIELSVGFGQMRTVKQLPVLTMVTGYSRWLSAVLIPSRCAQDLFAGWWQLINTISDPEHVAAARLLRRERIGLVRPAAEPDVEIRCLTDRLRQRTRRR